MQMRKNTIQRKPKAVVEQASDSFHVFHGPLCSVSLFGWSHDVKAHHARLKVWSRLTTIARSRATVPLENSSHTQACI
jgi:hypothetical protein